LKYPGFKAWWEERYDLTGLKKRAAAKLAPSHKYDLSYYTGGIVLFLFALQFITGMALALYYIPHFEHAHKSVIDIVTKLNMGWFFRSLHYWGAELAIAALFVHAFSALLQKSYRKPREALWFSGFVLLLISVFFGLTGYLLLWDERAFAAVRVVTGGAGNLPLVGSFIKAFLRGGLDVTGETLTRFHAFHVSILPLAAVLLAGLHILLVQWHGVSVPLSVEDKIRKKIPFFPNIFYRDLMVWLVALGIVVSLAALLPPEIGQKADPLAPAPENVKPEWYFLFLFQTLKLFPGEILGLNGETIAIVLITLALLFFLLIPLFDRKSGLGQKSPLFTWIGVLTTLYFVAMTIIGFAS
jgi:quinol-cytochrome oxidoreductase complex cytochrome b subunit